MVQIKTIKTTPAGMVEEFNNQRAHKESALIIVALETMQSIYLYYYADSDTARVHYYEANGVLRMAAENQKPAFALSRAAYWIGRALRLWAPYLVAPNSVFYDEKDLGRYSVHARDTKHGLKYDVVRMVGFKRVTPTPVRWGRHRHLFRFQRYFTTDYRSACAIAEYLNAKQNKRPRWRCFEVVKKYWGEKITLRWVAGSSINDGNFKEKFNVEIYRPEITSFFINNEKYK